MNSNGLQALLIKASERGNTGVCSKGKAYFLALLFFSLYASSAFSELSWSPESYRLSPYMSEAKSPAIGSIGTETLVIWSRLQGDRWSIDSITNTDDIWGTALNNISKGVGDAHSPSVLTTNAGFYGYWIVNGDSASLYESAYRSHLWHTPKNFGWSIREAQTTPYSIATNDRNERAAAWKINRVPGYSLAYSSYYGSWEQPTALLGESVEDLDVSMTNNGNFTIVKQSSGTVYAYRCTRRGFSQGVLAAGRSPSLGVDVNGNVVALWAGVFNGLSVIQSATQWGDGESTIWSSITNLSSIEVSSSNPVLSMSPSGNAIAVWQEGSTAIKGSIYRGGAWSAPFVIAVSKNGETLKQPQVVADQNERITVAWIRVAADGNSNIQARHYSSGAWGDVADVSSLVRGQDLSPKVSADANGKVTVVWVHYGDGPSYIMARRGSVTTKRSFSLTVNYDGTGRIVSYPSGIDCEPACNSKFMEGQEIVLSATPGPGSYFSGWSGSCSGKGNCTLSMTGDKLVTATFKPLADSYILSVMLDGPGLVTSNPVGINCGATCSGIFSKGAKVSLSAIPSTGNYFYGWTGACSGSGACTVSMDGAKTIGAVFTATPPPLNHNLIIKKTGFGTVVSVPAGINCGSECNSRFVDGSAVIMSAQPEYGYTFTGWGDACSGTGACELSMNSDKSVSANFVELPQIKVIKPSIGLISSEPAGILCGGPNKQCIASFLSATLTATPNPGNEFIKWNGCPAPEGNICSIKPTGKMTLKAVFKKLPKYNLKIIKNNFGSITSLPAGLNCPDKKKTCMVKFTKGTEVTLTPVPQQGRAFSGWTGACSGIDDCTILMDGNKGVGAAFQ